MHGGTPGMLHAHRTGRSVWELQTFALRQRSCSFSPDKAELWGQQAAEPGAGSEGQPPRLSRRTVYLPRGWERWATAEQR